MKTQKHVDPRITRRRVDATYYRDNTALYATYEIVGYEGDAVVLQKKVEFCPQKQVTA